VAHRRVGPGFHDLQFRRRNPLALGDGVPILRDFCHQTYIRSLSLKRPQHRERKLSASRIVVDHAIAHDKDSANPPVIPTSLIVVPAPLGSQRPRTPRCSGTYRSSMARRRTVRCEQCARGRQYHRARLD
jgi:hypothetical protein